MRFRRISADAPATITLSRPPSLPVDPPYLSARVPRNEDARLLTGRALFVDDVQLPGMLHVAFVRSEHAHGRLTGIDVSAARARPGVHAVYTAADLGDYLKPGPILVPPPPIPDLVFHPCTQLPLAKDKVRHVGEPIAMIVADSRYVAEDAIRDVVVDIDPIEAVVDLEKGLAPGAPLIHEHLRSNMAAHVRAAQGRLRVGEAEARTSWSGGDFITIAACRRQSRIVRWRSTGMRSPRR